MKYNYHKGDYCSIQSSLQTIQWKDRWKGLTVNEMWMDFKELLREVVDLHIPLKKECKKGTPIIQADAEEDQGKMSGMAAILSVPFRKKL